MKWITTTELGKRLGVYLTCKQIRTLTGMSGDDPLPGKGGGMLWHETQIPNIARALSEHFSRVAGDKKAEAPKIAETLGARVNLNLPLNASAKELVIGRTYVLPHGALGFWDGQRMQILSKSTEVDPISRLMTGEFDTGLLRYARMAKRDDWTPR